MNCDLSRCFRGFLLWTVLGLLLAGCTTVPETGRKQFNILSPQEEAQMGLTAFQQMKQEVPVSKDEASAAMVERAGKRISAVAPLPNAQWEFVLFESKEPNAFCLPGGKVGVYTGILPITQDEAGLATVIGHEVAHAVARHGGERVSQAMGIQAVGQILGATLSESEWQQAAVTTYGLGTQLGVALPYNRLQESEADRMGLLYMARAGYDPDKAIEFWQRFAEFDRQSGGDTLWFLRTHPLSEARAEELRNWLPEARREYLSSQQR